MVFQETERVPVYLPKEKCADYLYIKRGTMLIDNTLLDDKNEYRLRSTIGHECGHWVFHSDFYSGLNIRNYQKEILMPEATGCKKTDIEGGEESGGRRKLVTDVDWLEHHAKYFSAAILMPKTPFIHAASNLIEHEDVHEAKLSERLSAIFQVSSASANIRLSQLGFNKFLIRGEKIQDEGQIKMLF